MYEEIRTELGKFSKTYCRLINIVMFTTLGAIVYLPLGLLGLILGIVYVKLGFKFLEYMHNLMLFVKWYRKALANLFMKVMKFRNNRKPEVITSLHLSLGIQYIDKYYCSKTNRACRKLIRPEDEVLERLHIAYKEVYDMPWLVQLHLMRSNKWMAITCCTLASFSSMCLMMMFGNWIMLVFCFEMLAVVLFMCCFSNITEKLTVRAIKGQLTMGDLMFLNAYTDLSV